MLQQPQGEDADTTSAGLTPPPLSSYVTLACSCPTPGVLTEPVSLMPSTPRVPLKGDPSGAPLMPHF